MRGFCKCDLCGNVYHKDANKDYDGITVWRWKGSCNAQCLPDDDEKLITPDGESTDIPAVMDICPNCFERFYNWIHMNKPE